MLKLGFFVQKWLLRFELFKFFASSDRGETLWLLLYDPYEHTKNQGDDSDLLKCRKKKKSLYEGVTL